MVSALKLPQDAKPLAVTAPVEPHAPKESMVYCLGTRVRRRRASRLPHKEGCTGSDGIRLPIGLLKDLKINVVNSSLLSSYGLRHQENSHTALFNSLEKCDGPCMKSSSVALNNVQLIMEVHWGTR